MYLQRRRPPLLRGERVQSFSKSNLQKFFSYGSQSTGGRKSRASQNQIYKSFSVMAVRVGLKACQRFTVQLPNSPPQKIRKFGNSIRTANSSMQFDSFIGGMTFEFFFYIVFLVFTTKFRYRYFLRQCFCICGKQSHKFNVEHCLQLWIQLKL